MPLPAPAASTEARGGWQASGVPGAGPAWFHAEATRQPEQIGPIQAELAGAGGHIAPMAGKGFGEQAALKGLDAGMPLAA